MLNKRGRAYVLIQSSKRAKALSSRGNTNVLQRLYYEMDPRPPLRLSVILSHKLPHKP